MGISYFIQHPKLCADAIMGLPSIITLSELLFINACSEWGHILVKPVNKLETKF